MTDERLLARLRGRGNKDTIAAADRIEALTAVSAPDLETCGKCMGSGYGGHPDSGALCSDCNGTGGVSDGFLQRLDDRYRAIATLAEIEGSNAP